MRIFQRTRSVAVCRSVLFALIAFCCCASQAQAQWTTTVTTSVTPTAATLESEASPAYKWISFSIANIARLTTTAS